MLTYKEALKRLLCRIPAARTASLSLQESLGRVLAHSIVADIALPPFTKSFVDGYAVHSKDLGRAPAELIVIGEVAAGSHSHLQLSAGQTVKIMTGAALPTGAVAVQMVEKTRQISSSIVEILEPVRKGEHMALPGSEVEIGSTVLRPGTLIGSAEVGVLASFGYEKVEVCVAPTSAVISTGDELIELDQEPQFGQIRNSNAYMLSAQCRELGLQVTTFPIVPDDPKRTGKVFFEALCYDLLIFSGGVSMGEHDYVHRILREQQVDVFFHKVSIKPGKPILVGRKGQHLIFGLPGNPVSALVTFELFVRPAVRRWMGIEDGQLQQVIGTLLEPVSHRPGREFFKPAHTFWDGSGFQIRPIETKGSADITRFAAANSLLIVGQDTTCLQAGETARVMLLSAYYKRGDKHEIQPH